MITPTSSAQSGLSRSRTGLLAAAAPASHAFPLTSGHQYGNARVVAPPPNTVPASTSLNTLGGDDTVTAKRAKAKHAKGKVAHGNQRTGARRGRTGYAARPRAGAGGGAARDGPSARPTRHV